MQRQGRDTRGRCRGHFAGVMNVDVEQGSDIATAVFEVFEGVDTDQGSVDGYHRLLEMQATECRSVM